MAVSDQLKAAIEESGQSHYSIQKETGVPAMVIGRWMKGTRDNIRSDTIDTLAEYFGLELKPTKRRRKAKGE